MWTARFSPSVKIPCEGKGPCFASDLGADASRFPLPVFSSLSLPEILLKGGLFWGFQGVSPWLSLILYNIYFSQENIKKEIF